MSVSNVQRYKASIIGAITEALEEKIEKGELTEEDLRIIVGRASELSEDTMVSAVWLKDPDHPQGVGRTMRKLVGPLD